MCTSFKAPGDGMIAAAGWGLWWTSLNWNELDGFTFQVLTGGPVKSISHRYQFVPTP